MVNELFVRIAFLLMSYNTHFFHTRRIFVSNTYVVLDVIDIFSNLLTFFTTSFLPTLLCFVCFSGILSFPFLYAFYVSIFQLFFVCMQLSKLVSLYFLSYFSFSFRSSNIPISFTHLKVITDTKIVQPKFLLPNDRQSIYFRIPFEIYKSQNLVLWLQL